MVKHLEVLKDQHWLILLCHSWKTNSLTLIWIFLPAYYCRYVGNIFCVFDCLENVQKNFNFINNLHPNIKFTHEIGPKQLALLHTEIYLPSDIECVYTTKVFRKITNTNVFLNYYAICLLIWKIGLINCYLNRAFNVCSNWSLFHQEISILKNIYHQNGYPNRILYSWANKFLNNKFNPKAKDQNSKNENYRCMTLPYVGNASLFFTKSSYHPV